ncbi:MAG: hypothetical protein LUD14_07635 [Clostridiales bacterium]|nr:hypothetical protein [Clostridiales bacterium]
MSDETARQPILDTLIQSRDLQILKAMVPYLDSTRQRGLSLMIRLIELQKTMQLFDPEAKTETAELHTCENESPTDRTLHMLQAIKEFCTPQEADNIDNMIHTMDMLSSYETLRTEGMFDL